MTPDVSIPGGAITTIATTGALLPRADCATIVAQRQLELVRISMIAGVAPTSTATVWGVFAGPTREVGWIGPFVLAYQYGSGSDAAQLISYGNPFAGYDVFGRIDVTANLTPPAYISTQLDVAMPADCSTVTLEASVLAVASAIAIGGQSITTNGQTFMLDPQVAQPITFATTGGGNADYFGITLLDVSGPGWSYITTGNHITVGPGTLKHGHSYQIFVTTRLGVPNAAAGDFRTTQFPRGRAVTASATFVIQ